MKSCERKWEWNGFDIRPSRNGKAWVWSQWSGIQGNLTCARLYIPVTDEFPANVDWDEPVNECAGRSRSTSCMDKAETFNAWAREVLSFEPEERRRLGIQLLSRGWIVQ